MLTQLFKKLYDEKMTSNIVCDLASECANSAISSFLNFIKSLLFTVARSAKSFIPAVFFVLLPLPLVIFPAYICAYI